MRFSLIYGSKESPDQVLDLNDGAALRVRGDAGALGVGSGAGPVESVLLLDVMGQSQADLRRVVAVLDRWALLARSAGVRLTERGNMVWLRYSWVDLDLETPTMGQWYSYVPVYDLAVGLPASLHSGNLPGDNPLIEGLSLTLHHGPQAVGLEEQCFLTDSTNATAQASRTMGSEFNGDFTLMGWVYHNGSSNKSILKYDSTDFALYQSSANSIKWYWAGTLIYDTAEVGGYFGEAVSVGVGWHHWAISYKDTSAPVYADTATLYLDGEVVAVFTEEVGLFTVDKPSAGGVLLFNDDNNFDIANYRAWRAFGSVLTTAAVSAIYAQESLIDDWSGYGSLPLLYTSAGSGSISNVDGAVSTVAKDNHAVVWGVGGDRPARLRVTVTLPGSLTDAGVWLGRLAHDSVLTSTSSWWVDLSGTADSGNSSGDAYEGDTTSGAGTDSSDFDGSLSDLQRGRVSLLARLKVDGADSEAVGRLEYNGVVYAQTNEISTTDSASFLLQLLGDLVIDWPESAAPASATVAVVVSEQEATALTTGCDFICLLPWPYIYVKTDAAVSTSAGDKLHIYDDFAWLESSAGAWASRWYARGGPLTLEPGRYNHLVWLLGEEGEAYTVGTDVTLQVYVTPVWGSE
jgi:hypothetical protein